MKKTKVVIVITACMFLFGCSLSDNNRVVFDSAAFDRARAAWEAQGITCYTFDIVMIPGGRDYRVIVRNGEAVNAELLWSTEENIDVEETLRSLVFSDVPAFFDWIESIYNASLGWNIERGTTFHLRVEYNADYHFPESMSTSWRDRRTRRPMVGGVNSTGISNFRPAEK